MKFWNRLGKKKQNEILILISFAMVAVYILAWHWHQYADLKHTENMVNRAENRLELTKDRIPTMPDSAGTLSKKINDLSTAKTELLTSFNQIKTLFMPLDDIQKYQNLRLDISDLAEKNGVRVNQVDELNQGRSAVDQFGNPISLFISPEWGRPLISYQMSLRYIDLLNFLEQLETLEYQVSPVNIEIEAEFAEDEKVNDPTLPQYLNVALVLSL